MIPSLVQFCCFVLFPRGVDVAIESGVCRVRGELWVVLARTDHDPRRAGRLAGDPKVHFDLDQQKLTFWTEDDWDRVRDELEHRIGQALTQLRTKTD